jgi:hypothetical protein
MDAQHFTLVLVDQLISQVQTNNHNLHLDLISHQCLHSKSQPKLYMDTYFSMENFLGETLQELPHIS